MGKIMLKLVLCGLCCVAFIAGYALFAAGTSFVFNPIWYFGIMAAACAAIWNWVGD